MILKEFASRDLHSIISFSLEHKIILSFDLEISFCVSLPHSGVTDSSFVHYCLWSYERFVSFLSLLTILVMISTSEKKRESQTKALKWERREVRWISLNGFINRYEGKRIVMRSIGLTYGRKQHQYQHYHGCLLRLDLFSHFFTIFPLLVIC